MQRRRYKRQRMLAPLPETLQYDNNNNKNNNNKTKKHSAVRSTVQYFIKLTKQEPNKRGEPLKYHIS
jgi:hypothetical protein